MHKPFRLGDMLLLVTAAIWGFAFVAQRAGMDHVGPFTFNGIRFALGGLALIPVRMAFLRRGAIATDNPHHESGRPTARATVRFGIASGLALFVAASLQQAGMVYTTAGNAGFITGLYVVIVPVLGITRGQAVGWVRWIAVIIAVAGLYLLSVTPGTAVNPGDLLVLGSALFFAIHVQMMGHAAHRFEVLLLSMTQYAVVATASLTVAFWSETLTANALAAALPAILYGGLGSISIAYTLQVFGQRTADPTHAAIILSLEGAFAALGGWLLLSEYLSVRALVGCGLMLGGMLISQLWPQRTKVVL